MKDHILQKYGTYDTALARIRELEAKMGRPLTQSFDDICAAWDHIEALEAAVAAKTTTVSGRLPQSKPQSARPAKPLFGLARAMAANSKNK